MFQRLICECRGEPQQLMDLHVDGKFSGSEKKGEVVKKNIIIKKRYIHFCCFKSLLWLKTFVHSNHDGIY